MPPLRERKDDIPLLIQHFLSRKVRHADDPPSRITEEAMDQLMAYDWPGNVRQLENTIERAVVLSQGRLIGPEHLLLPDDERGDQDDLLTSALGDLLNRGEGLDAMLNKVRANLVRLALQRQGGDRTAAAQLLDIPEEQLDQGTPDV
jgi:DNA-binding NtrC family response regulator